MEEIDFKKQQFTTAGQFVYEYNHTKSIRYKYCRNDQFNYEILQVAYNYLEPEQFKVFFADLTFKHTGGATLESLMKSAVLSQNYDMMTVIYSHREYNKYITINVLKHMAVCMASIELSKYEMLNPMAADFVPFIERCIKELDNLYTIGLCKDTLDVLVGRDYKKIYDQLCQKFGHDRIIFLFDVEKL